MYYSLTKEGKSDKKLSPEKQKACKHAVLQAFEKY
jgi:hypothetical protein